jgi:hypothetical protein
MSNGRIKLGEAQYFLGQMRDTVSDHEAFAYNLSAFLSAGRSVTLLLQREFAHTPGFKEWSVREQDRLKVDQRMVLFNDKRVEAVHIRPVAPNAKVDLSLRETIYASESLLVEKLDAEGNVLETREISSPPPTRAPAPPLSVEWRWYFEELSDIDVVSACEEQVGKLRRIVDECERRFET